MYIILTQHCLGDNGMRCVVHIVHMGERKGVYRILVDKHEGKKPHGRLGRRWKENIKMDLQEAECGHMDWIELAQDRDSLHALLNKVINVLVP